MTYNGGAADELAGLVVLPWVFESMATAAAFARYGPTAVFPVDGSPAALLVRVTSGGVATSRVFFFDRYGRTVGRLYGGRYRPYPAPAEFEVPASALGRLAIDVYRKRGPQWLGGMFAELAPGSRLTEVAVPEWMGRALSGSPIGRPPVDSVLDQAIVLTADIRDRLLASSLAGDLAGLDPQRVGVVCDYLLMLWAAGDARYRDAAVAPGRAGVGPKK